MCYLFCSSGFLIRIIKINQCLKAAMVENVTTADRGFGILDGDTGGILHS